jgi:hypothetical protein
MDETSCSQSTQFSTLMPDQPATLHPYDCCDNCTGATHRDRTSQMSHPADVSIVQARPWCDANRRRRVRRAVARHVALAGAEERKMPWNLRRRRIRAYAARARTMPVDSFRCNAKCLPGRLKMRRGARKTVRVRTGTVVSRRVAGAKVVATAVAGCVGYSVASVSQTSKNLRLGGGNEERPQAYSSCELTFEVRRRVRPRCRYTWIGKGGGREGRTWMPSSRRLPALGSLEARAS